MRRALSAGIGAIVFVVACETKPLPTAGGGGLGGVNGRDQISSLADTSDTAIVSSGEVESGYQFTVSFKTVAHDCVWPDYVAVQGGDAAVTVTPYDANTSGPGIMCPSLVTTVPRSTQVVLTKVGLDTINLRGYGGPGPSAQTITVRKVIKVIP